MLILTTLRLFNIGVLNKRGILQLPKRDYQLTALDPLNMLMQDVLTCNGAIFVIIEAGVN